MKTAVVFIGLLLFTVLPAMPGDVPVTAAENFDNGGLDDLVMRPDADGNHIEVHHGGILLAYGHISGEATHYNWPTGGKLITLSSNGDIHIKNVMPDSVMMRLNKQWK